MKLNITKTLEKARLLLEEEKQISPALKAMFEMLLVMVNLLASKLGLNSKNSSTPPASDPNRKKKKKPKNTNNKPGGQPGRVGKNLKPVSDPDTIIPLKLDKRTLPKGTYTDVGFESRQVMDLEISRIVTEYQAQILEDVDGKRYVAPFPEGVSRPIQYGQFIKAHAVYLSQFQLIPYGRVADYFMNEVAIPVSVGSLFNFNKEAYDRLQEFDDLAKKKLQTGTIINSDETGVNINGKRVWLHNASNEQWTYFYPHNKRGTEAMDAIGILPVFSGTLIHDHWKPYYTYKKCKHGLCNAHHVRELEWVMDNFPSYTWAKDMQALLFKINEAVNKTENNVLKDKVAQKYRVRYKNIIKTGDNEMPPPLPDPNQVKQKKRIKKTKERNLLERLRDFEDDTLRFMIDSEVPFTNNRGENDIRMTKVQQKISGCFKSVEGAKIFCRVRSYLLTAQKHKITPTEALKTLFSGKLPDILLSE